MRTFKDGETIYVEPFRAQAFPIVRDLIVDRSALDRIIQAGGYVSVRTGSAPDANSLPVPKFRAPTSPWTRRRASAAARARRPARTAARCSSRARRCRSSRLLPQGQAERGQRAVAMVRQMDKEGFGNCSNVYNCSAVCPKEISASFHRADEPRLHARQRAGEPEQQPRAQRRVRIKPGPPGRQNTRAWRCAGAGNSPAHR